MLDKGEGYGHQKGSSMVGCKEQFKEDWFLVFRETAEEGYNQILMTQRYNEHTKSNCGELIHPPYGIWLCKKCCVELGLLW